MFETSRLAVTPEDTVTEFNRLYLEKCKEVNELERKMKDKNEELDKMKQEALTGDLISRAKAIDEIQAAFAGLVIYPPYMQNYDVDYVKNQYAGKLGKALQAVRDIPAVSNSSTIRELAAEPIKGFFPDVVPPEELPECLLDETVTTHDILCLSSALKNLFEIHKCDSFALYIKLSRVLEKKIEEYCKEEG